MLYDTCKLGLSFRAVFIWQLGRLQLMGHTYAEMLERNINAGAIDASGLDMN